MDKSPLSPYVPPGLNNQTNGPRVTHCQNLFSDYSSPLLNNCLVKNFQNHHVWVECTAIKGKKNIIYVLHIFGQVLFWAENQGNCQNFNPSLPSKKLWLIFMGMKQKKNPKWPTQKNWDFQLLQYFFSQKFQGVIHGWVG